MTYFDDLKYEKFVSDFNNIRLINFDMINLECRGTPLQNPEAYYKTIEAEALKIINHMFKTMQYHLQLNQNAMTFILNIFKEKTVVENALVYNDFFLKKRKEMLLILPN